MFLLDDICNDGDLGIEDLEEYVEVKPGAYDTVDELFKIINGFAQGEEEKLPF